MSNKSLIFDEDDRKDETEEEIFDKHPVSKNLVKDCKSPIFYIFENNPPSYPILWNEEYEVWYIYAVDGKLFPAKRLTTVTGKDILENTEEIWDEVFVKFMDNSILNSKIIGLGIMNAYNIGIWKEVNECLCTCDEDLWNQLTRFWPAKFYFEHLSQIYFLETRMP